MNGAASTTHPPISPLDKGGIKEGSGGEPIAKQQIRKIKTLQSKMKMPDEDYRLMLSEYWVNSCKELSYAESENFIKELTALALKQGVWKTGKEKYNNLGNRQGMAAPSKLRMIEAMWKNISYTHDSHKRGKALRKFIFNIVRVDDLAFLTADGADKVINALRHIKRRHTQPPRIITPPSPSYLKRGTRGGVKNEVYRDRSNNF